MSIRRPKRASRKAEPDLPNSLGAGGSAHLPDWGTAVGPRPDADFVPYAPATTFALSTLILHAKFGKGVVVGVDGNKVDILFEQGIRKLLHASPS
jgi:hypothetical protein